MLWLEPRLSVCLSVCHGEVTEVNKIVISSIQFMLRYFVSQPEHGWALADTEACSGVNLLKLRDPDPSSPLLLPVLLLSRYSLGPMVGGPNP